ncbi:hypothetical protein OQJ26_07055 [Legionella sp. PATHC038]|uniref:hypothetical protein n=1 Tax=Legionella sheltonii TaxID=2992041 RepID=UPI002244C6B2|nr:hypothetical protein [Legionella sp. PATHC038]MCW8398549.1 hypothetical protein [Legionella sp. PATHC038]
MHYYKLDMVKDLDSAISALRSQLDALLTQVKESDAHLSQYFDVAKITAALSSTADKTFGLPTLTALEMLAADLIQVKEIADLSPKKTEQIAEVMKATPSLMYAVHFLSELSEAIRETERLLNIELVVNSTKENDPETISVFNDQSISYSLTNHSFERFSEFQATDPKEQQSENISWKSDLAQFEGDPERHSRLISKQITNCHCVIMLDKTTQKVWMMHVLPRSQFYIKPIYVDLLHEQSGLNDKTDMEVLFFSRYYDQHHCDIHKFTATLPKEAKRNILLTESPASTSKGAYFVLFDPQRNKIIMATHSLSECRVYEDVFPGIEPSPIKKPLFDLQPALTIAQQEMNELKNKGIMIKDLSPGSTIPPEHFQNHPDIRQTVKELIERLRRENKSGDPKAAQAFFQKCDFLIPCSIKEVEHLINKKKLLTSGQKENSKPYDIEKIIFDISLEKELGTVDAVKDIRHISGLLHVPNKPLFISSLSQYSQAFKECGIILKLNQEIQERSTWLAFETNGIWSETDTHRPGYFYPFDTCPTSESLKQSSSINIQVFGGVGIQDISEIWVPKTIDKTLLAELKTLQLPIYQYPLQKKSNDDSFFKEASFVPDFKKRQLVYESTPSSKPNDGMCSIS